VDPDPFARLLSAPGSAVLAEASASYRSGDELTLVAGLRRRYDADLVTAAVTQASLRHRATAKLGPDAARMFFTADGLEQATRTTVATHRAERIAKQLPGATVIDLGCGIGGDLIAMSRAELNVTGVERDPFTAAVARANLSVLGLAGEVLTGDAEDADHAAYDVVFADPARRADGRRVFDRHAYSPPWSFVTGLLERTACVKVAPGIPHDAVPDGVEAEWVSDAGEVKEAALWSGALATDAVRRATLLPSGTTVTNADAAEPETGPVGRYLYEPDGAVIRAGLVTAVCEATTGHLLDPRIAYVTADRHTPTGLATAYEVLEHLPYNEKALRRWVRDHRVGTLEIKKRGVDLDPAVLRRRLNPRGDGSATFVITRIGRDAVVYVVRRV
jgi:THUMP domain-containing protein/methyltransferase family protein